MNVASTIIVAREDFSIPGAAENLSDRPDDGIDEKQRFFALLQESRPDVVVLNLTVTKGRGVETIQTVREQSGVPILVVCASADPLKSDYRSAGAAECLHPPVDIRDLNRTIRNVIGPTDTQTEGRPQTSEGFRFRGITYRPDQQSLAGAQGVLAPLTTVENAVLKFLVSQAWAVCSREQIAESAYGDTSALSQRRVRTVVSRLRKKLEAAGGVHAGRLIRTDPRIGYTWVVDVVSFPLQESGDGS